MLLPTKGTLSTTSFIEILKHASQSQLTGMVRVEAASNIKVTYFQKGLIAFASSNARLDRLTEVLKRAGKLTPEQVEDAQNRQKPNISLGKWLVELGYISGRDLLWGAKAQVEGILHDLLFWNQGSYQILQGPLPQEIIHLNLPASTVIFDGIAKCQNRDWILQRIESPESVYKLARNLTSENGEIKIPHDTDLLLLDGTKSLREIAEATNRDTFEICKTVAALQELSLATRISEPAVETPQPIVSVNSQSPEEEEPFPIQEDEVVAPARLAIGTDEPFQIEPLERKPETPPEEAAAATPDLSSAAIKNSQAGSPTVESVSINTNGELFSDQTDEESASKRGLIIAVIIGVIALGVWYFAMNHNQEQPSMIETTAPQPKAAVVPDPTNETVAPAPPEEPPEKQSTPRVDENSPSALLKSGNIEAAAEAWKNEYSSRQSAYTIQLAIACREKTILEASDMFNDSDDFAVLPLKYRGQNCYRLIHGVYPSRSAAQSALSSLPEQFLKQSSPPAVIALPRTLQ